MNVSELYNLTFWIEENISKAGLPGKYQALSAILQQHTTPNGQKSPFETQKDDLLESLEEVPLYTLTKDQLSFLHQLDIAKAVGKEGIETIKEILYRNSLDVATAYQKIQEIQSSLNSGIQKSTQIKSGLDDCVEQEEFESDDEVLMRIGFTDEASMSDITDFKKWGKIWFDIGRGIAMVHDASPEDIKIIGATKGSIILELAVAYGIASTISKIILSALNVAEKVIDLRHKAEEFRALKLRNTKLASQIETEAENQKNEGIDIIATTITKDMKINKNGDGEKIKVLETSIKNLVNFIEKGGDIDFVMPEEDIDEDGESTQDSELQELRVAFQEIRKLESKLALLEHHKNPNKTFEGTF